MGHTKCSNSNCKHNDQYFCTAKGLDEDIVCKQGKADAIKKVKCLTPENKSLKS